MSITKFFNRKYAMQNIKKSKAILGLIIIAVPIITLFAMYFFDVDRYSNPFDLTSLFIINYFGMFIIPFIVSACFMGFCYKKTSVDFVCSMPLNKKTIFITNLIAGIVYLVLLQLLTLIITSCYVIMVPSTLFSISMAVDVFFMMSLSYIFIYSICMLAASVSGNIVTQIVVSLLVLFLVPFTRIAMFEDVNFGMIPSFFHSMEDGAISYTPVSMTYSLPISTFIYGVESGSPGLDFTFVGKSMLYSMILVAVYSIAGVILFEKRKLENAGTSFQNDFVHVIVKGLTLYPIVALLVYVKSYENIAVLGLAIIIMAVYYIIYDMITFKKMKLMPKIGSFIVSVFFLYMMCYCMLEARGSMTTSTITDISKEISNVSFNLPTFWGDDVYIEIKNDEIKDELIQKIRDNKVQAVEETVEEKVDYQVSNNKYESNNAIINIRLIMEIKGNKYITYSYIMRQDMIDVIDAIRKDKNTIDNLANAYVTDGKIIASTKNYGYNKEKVDYSNDLRKYISNNKYKYIDKMLEKLEKKLMNNTDIVDYSSSLCVYKYYNHKKHAYLLVFMPEFPEIEQMVAEELNREAVISLRKMKEGKRNKITQIEICSVDNGIMSSKHWNGVNDKRSVDYLIQEASKKPDTTKEYYIIDILNNDENIVICTSDTKSIKEHFALPIEQDEVFMDYRY